MLAHNLCIDVITLRIPPLNGVNMRYLIAFILILKYTFYYNSLSSFRGGQLLLYLDFL
jgi:hypothetical protein